MKQQRLTKEFLLATGVLIAIISFFFSACTDKVEITQKYTVMEPVYQSPEDIRAAFDVIAPEPIRNTGKIYMYGQYIFLNEPGEGIHIIDNSDKRNPQVISFIKIPGNYDMAAQGDRLFADSYLDLVAIDISDPLNVKLVTRIKDVFRDIAIQNNYYDPEKGVIIAWEPKEVIEVTSDQFGGTFPSYYYYGRGIALFGAAMNDMATLSIESAPIVQTGVGGSMARFTISNRHLYTIGSNNLYVFDITNLDKPVPGANMNIGWGIETIFPYKDNLFIGTNSGMLIYNISDPNVPEHLSTFSHIMSCDPVVVEGDIAYVTLRSGTGCRNDFTNQLDVVDISDLTNPKLLKTYPMTNPHGLGIDNDILFLTEGSAGLKVFDATDKFKITDHLLAYYNEFDAFDVIPFDNTLLLIGNDGLFQFDYSDPANMEFLSKIEVKRDNPLE